MATFPNPMANIIIFSLLFLCTKKFAFGNTCTKMDSLHYHNFTNCRIVPVLNKTNIDIMNFMQNDQMNLLKIEFDFPESTKKAIEIKQLKFRINEDDASHFYEPFQWNILTSHIGNELLTLKPNFQTLSLNTLNVGIEVMNITMLDKPLGCLENLTIHRYLYIVKEYIIHLIKETNKREILVCTAGMKNVNNIAKFNPVCYGINMKNDSRKCNYLETGHWSYGLYIFINSIKFIAILFFPLIIPSSIYKSKYLDDRYCINLNQHIPIKVMVSNQKHPEIESTWKFSLPISYFNKWKSFNPNNLKIGIVYNFEVTTLNLSVKSDTLVSKSNVPASFFDLIYEKCYLCNIGHDMAFKWCCYSPICPDHMQCKQSSTYTCMPWLKCCQGFMKFLLILLIPQPWILRLLVYYFYEKIDFDTRRLAAEKHGLSLSFKGYLLGYISPIHWAFIIIYGLYAIDLLIFGILVKGVLRALLKIIKESFRDMNASFSFEILRWGVSRYLVPFSYLGLIGIVLAPIYWLFITPFVMVIFCFYYIPLVSLFSRLILHLIWFCLPDFAINSKCLSVIKHYAGKMHLISKHLDIHTISPHRKILKTDSRSDNCLHRHFQILVVFLCLLTVTAITILITECIGYIIDIVAFTLIGLILHTNTVLPYFSFVFMMVIYLSTSIKDVRVTYLDFNKIIISEIVNAANDELKVKTEWSHTAHFIQPDGGIAPSRSLSFGKSGSIYFNATSLVLFINQEDHAYIPNELFYNICEMPVSTCPGSRSLNYFKAFVNFFYVLIFLVFVMIVVLSFGGLYNISSTHQMFAALAGGFLPYIFQNVIQLNPAPEQVNTNALAFKKHFWMEINNFEQYFKVQDFDTQLISKEDSRNKDAPTLDSDSDHTVIEIQKGTDYGNESNSNSYVYFDGPFKMDI